MSTDRQQPDPINDELVARIDDWVENVLDPQACAAALRTVLAIAKAAEDGALRWQDQLPVPEWVVDVRQGIANALRITATRQPLALQYPADTCIYCGMQSHHMDHLIPESWTGLAARRHVITVPACRECNTAIGDLLTFSITERRAVAQSHIRRRNGKWLRVQPRTEKELREYGRTLRASIRDGMQRRAETERRLAWPEDPFYDLHALERSGIEEPYGCGLLAAPADADSATEALR